MEDLLSSDLSLLLEGPEMSPSMEDFEFLLHDLPYDEENQYEVQQQMDSEDQMLQNGDPNHHDESAPPSAMMMTMNESERLMVELFANSSTSQPLGTGSPISSNRDDVLTVADKSQPPAPPPETTDFSMLKAKLDMACAAAATIFAGSEPEGSRKNQLSSDSSNEVIEINDVAGARRENRKAPNRGSTKYCSRKRDHDNINALESKIYELMDENASLVSQIADMKKKNDEVVADNVAVKSEVMALKATVSVVERTVKQLLRMNPDVLLTLMNSQKEGHGQQIGQGGGLMSPAASTNVGVPGTQAEYIVGIPCGPGNVPVNHGAGIGCGVGVGVNGPFPSTYAVPVNHGVGVNGPFTSAGTVLFNQGLGANSPFTSAGSVLFNHGVGANGAFPSAGTVSVNHGVGVSCCPFASANHGAGVNCPFASATSVFRDQTQAGGMAFYQQGNNHFGLGHTFLG